MTVYVAYDLIDGITTGKYDPIKVNVKLIADQNTSFWLDTSENWYGNLPKFFQLEKFKPINYEIIAYPVEKDNTFELIVGTKVYYIPIQYIEKKPKNKYR